MYAYTEKEQKEKKQATIQKREQESVRPNQTGIPDAIKNRYEQASGFSFDDVRVQYNSSKPDEIKALAYTQGNRVYIGPGQEKHLEHELTHVVQQKQGRVRPTDNVGGMPVNDDTGLEREADGGAIQHKAVYKNELKPIVQRFKEKDEDTESIDLKTGFSMETIKKYYEDFIKYDKSKANIERCSLGVYRELCEKYIETSYEGDMKIIISIFYELIKEEASSVEKGSEATEISIMVHDSVDKKVLTTSFKPALDSIMTYGKFENGSISGIICSPSNKKSFMSTLFHTTRPGSGSYAGVSIWGKVEDGVIVIYALAQHGSNNKEYTRVSGNTAIIPGSWTIP